MRFLKSLEMTSIWSLPSPTVGSGITGGGFLAGSVGAGAGCGPGSDIMLIRCCRRRRHGWVGWEERRAAAGKGNQRGSGSCRGGVVGWLAQQSGVGGGRVADALTRRAC